MLELNLTESFAINLQVADYLQQGIKERPLLSILPIEYQNSPVIKWEMPDNGYGLIPLRGENGTPPTVQVTGVTQFSVEGGYYGGKMLIDEKEINRSRQWGTANEPMDPEQLTAFRFQTLTGMGLDQITNTSVQMLLTGAFLNRSPDGLVTHSDQIDNYNVLIPTTSWTDHANSTPIDDLLAWKNTLQTGTSSRFDENSTLWMSSATANDLFANAQILARRLTYGSTPMGMKEINGLLTMYDLPQIRVDDTGYFPTVADGQNRTNFTKFLPYKKIIWQGVRPGGVPIGRFYLTRNMVTLPHVGTGFDYSAKNPWTGTDKEWMAGVYNLLMFKQEPPPHYRLDHGYNGGPGINYPSAVAGIAYA